MMKMNKNIKCIIFDMDGVLFDSEKMYFEEVKAFLLNYHIVLTLDMYKEVIGVSNFEFERKIMEWTQSNKSMSKMHEELNEYFGSLNRDFSVYLKAGVIELLEYLKSGGYKIGLASSSRLELIEQALIQAKINEYFDIVLSGENFVESKPNPEIYLTAMNCLECTSDETLIVEDSPSGIQAGKSTGAIVIAIEDDYFQLNQRQADAHIKEISEIKAYI